MVLPSGEMARSAAANGTAALKYIGGSTRWLAFHQPNAAPRNNTVDANAAIQPRRRLFAGGTGTAVEAAVWEPLSAIHFSSLARSLALCQRSSGSFARHCRTTRSRAGGAMGCTCDIGGGSVVRMEAIRLARLRPEKAGLPVAISKSTVPRAKRSVRA